MGLGWILTGFFIFVTLIFIAIAFFLPEWVGITGKKAREIMKEQMEVPKDQPSRDPSLNGQALQTDETDPKPN